MKKMNYLLRLTAIALILGSVCLAACNKEKDNVANEAGTLESMEDNTISDISYDTELDQAQNLAADFNPDFFSAEPPATPNGRQANPANARLQGCAKVTLDTTVFPITVTIDFGEGCPGRGNRIRKGKIITIYSDKMRKPGSVATTTFQDFYVDSMKVEGTLTVTNQTNMMVPLSQVQPKFRRQLANGKLSWPSGRWITRSFDRTFTFIQGFQTRIRQDDRIAIVGTGRGENRRGKSWANEITETLVWSGKCDAGGGEITKGIIRFRHNAVVGTLNYGSNEEECDGKALLSVNGTSREIRLK